MEQKYAEARTDIDFIACRKHSLQTGVEISEENPIDMSIGNSSIDSYPQVGAILSRSSNNAKKPLDCEGANDRSSR